jgi:hypothetical protein
MSLMFQEEAKFSDNRPRTNFVFLGFPYASPLPLDDYRQVLTQLEATFPIRFWYFLVEYTTEELMRKLWRGILRSDLCVFDLSGGSPNVSFEIGLAVARFKRCSTILKTGAENPLGSADMAYAERAEYNSSNTLKETLTRVIKSKSTALATLRQAAQYLHDSSKPRSVDNIEALLTTIVNEVFQNGKITKQAAERIVNDRPFTDAAMNHLRERQVLAIEGSRRGAKWILGEEWVSKSHEVAGIV